MKVFAPGSDSVSTRSSIDSPGVAKSGARSPQHASRKPPNAEWLADIQAMADRSRPPAPVHESRNESNLPTALKASVESLSGVSMNDVRVHYDSDRPAKLDSYAYTQGSDIYVGPGQESHLQHEAWHVVQQKQGRVTATGRDRGVALNDDPALEREATLMGERASRGSSRRHAGSAAAPSTGNANESPVVQRAKHPTFGGATINGNFNARTRFWLDSDGDAIARSPKFDITGSVNITPGTDLSKNSGIQIGFVQTLLNSSATGKYRTHDRKQERYQIRISQQPVRDGDKGLKPWYEVDDVVDWDGQTPAVSTGLEDTPQRAFYGRGMYDGQDLYGTEGVMTFKTWLIAWHNKSAKYLRWVTWTVDFNSTVAGNQWRSDNNSRITGRGPGAGRNPGAAELGDPVANDVFVYKWRKVNV